VTTEERPDGACLLHPPPREGRPWTRADDHYRTCSSCLDRLRDLLRDINRRYHLLNPAPGQTGDHGGRGAPGFGSRSPASEHVIAMRDTRSVSYPVVDEWYEPLKLPANLFGHDRRTTGNIDHTAKPYREQDNPPRSVPKALASICGMVAEDRDMTPPPAHATVPDLVRWIDQQLDHITRQAWVADVAGELRGLDAQLRPVTGEPGRRHIGLCPNVIDEGEHSRACEAKLYAPLRGDEIRCRTCGRVWPRDEWLRLGNLLEAS
jgi:hypothetical protein